MKLKFGLFPYVCVCVVVSAMPVHAAGLYWDGASTGPDADGGEGAWSTAASPANWDDSASGGSEVAWTDGSDAVFGGTGGVVTVSGTVSAASLGFTSAGYQLAGGQIVLTGAPVIDVGGNDVTVASVVAGSAPIVKEGAGTLTLSGANTYTGSTTVNAGTLRVDGSGSLASSSVAISSAAAVTYHNTSAAVVNVSSAFSGSGGLNFASSNDGSNGFGKFSLNGNNSGFTGPVTVSDARISLTSGKQAGSGTITLTGRAALEATGVTVPNALVLNTTNRWGGGRTGSLFLTNATLSGPITLPGGIYTVVNIPGATVSHSAISGPIGEAGGKGRLQVYAEAPGSTLTLSGASTYTGITIVDYQGTLNLTGSLGATQVSVGTGGTLSGNGVIGAGGSLSMFGGTIKAGTTGGALTVNGDFYLGTGSQVALDVKPGPIATGPIPVLNYTGARTGPSSTLRVVYPSSYIPLPYRKAVVAVTPGLITVDIGSKALAWRGASGGVWDTGQAMTWAIPDVGTAMDRFYRGDSVLFDDIGPGSSVSGTEIVEPSDIVVNNSTKNYSISTPIVGPCSINKYGTGSVGFGSANHTGGTTVHAGRLTMNGSGPVTIAAGATLSGYNINGPVNVAGSIDPGTANITRTILATGPLTLSGSYRCEMYASDSDQIAVTGNLDLTGSSLTLSQAVAGTPFSYVIATYTGTLTGSFGPVTGVPAGYALRYDNAGKKIIVRRAGFPEWAAGYPGVSDATPDGDPDGDGLPNLVEYVLSGNPGFPNREPIGSVRPYWSMNANNLYYRYRRVDSSRFSTTQVVQWSSDMKTWTDIPIPMNTAAPVAVSPNGSGPDDITVTIARAPGGKMYVRLKVTEL